jgi:hypothetical protein
MRQGSVSQNFPTVLFIGANVSTVPAVIAHGLAHP